jgi:hypothetical protein
MTQLDLFDIGVEHINYREHYGFLNGKPHTYALQYTSADNKRVLVKYSARHEDRVMKAWSRSPCKLFVYW